MKISAVIVAKKDSRRLTNKNMLPFGNSTLLGHKITKLLECKEINDVVVGSDCDDILFFAEKLGARPIKRPDVYCDEIVSSANDMIGNMCSLIETDIVVWSHCTNPLIKPETYDQAVRTFLANLQNKSYDSLLSVDKLQEHLWSYSESEKKYVPHNYNPWGKSHVLAKDLPVLYKQNGAIFIQEYNQMKQNSYFFGKNPYLFEMNPEESIDINTESDFEIAKILYQQKYVTH